MLFKMLSLITVFLSIVVIIDSHLFPTQPTTQPPTQPTQPPTPPAQCETDLYDDASPEFLNPAMTEVFKTNFNSCLAIVQGSNQNPNSPSCNDIVCSIKCGFESFGNVSIWNSNFFNNLIFL